MHGMFIQSMIAWTHARKLNRAFDFTRRPANSAPRCIVLPAAACDCNKNVSAAEEVVKVCQPSVLCAAHDVETSCGTSSSRSSGGSSVLVGSRQQE